MICCDSAPSEYWVLSRGTSLTARNTKGVKTAKLAIPKSVNDQRQSNETNTAASAMTMINCPRAFPATAPLLAMPRRLGNHLLIITVTGEIDAPAFPIPNTTP